MSMRRIPASTTRVPTHIATRIARPLASLAVTALIVGSQLGNVDPYTRQADALLAAKMLHQPVAQHVTSLPQRRS